MEVKYGVSVDRVRFGDLLPGELFREDLSHWSSVFIKLGGDQAHSACRLGRLLDEGTGNGLVGVFASDYVVVRLQGTLVVR
jgi:hypothetical protein